MDLAETLKEGTRGSGGTHTRLLSRSLVIAEVALALVLLVAAGLMIRSFMNVQEMSASFQSEKIMMGWIYMGGTTYITYAPRIQFLERLESELRTISGAKVAMTSSLPLGGGQSWQFEVDGKPVTVPEGTSIWDAAQTLNINIPVLCHKPGLTPIGVCRSTSIVVRASKIGCTRDEMIRVASTLAATNGAIFQRWRFRIQK